MAFSTILKVMFVVNVNNHKFGVMFLRVYQEIDVVFPSQVPITLLTPIPRCTLVEWTTTTPSYLTPHTMDVSRTFTSVTETTWTTPIFL